MKLDDALAFYPSFTQEDIALLTGLKIHEVRAALDHLGHDLQTKMTPQWRQEILIECSEMTASAVGKLYRMTGAAVVRARYSKLPSNKPRGRPQVDHTDLKNFIISNPHMTQVELAAAAGCSQALISMLSPTRKPIGNVQRRTPGEKVAIINYAKANGVSAAARLYGVSRTAIHNWMDKA